MARKYPEMVTGLILASGYYYPTLRGDAVILSGPSFPLIGDIMSHTVSPILARIMRPLFMRKLFGPAPTPKKFAKFPKAISNSLQRRGDGAHDSRRACIVQGLRRFENAHRHYCWRARQADRHQQAVGAASSGHSPEHAAPRPGRRPHGPSIRHGRRNGGDRRSFRFTPGAPGNGKSRSFYRKTMGSIVLRAARAFIAHPSSVSRYKHGGIVSYGGVGSGTIRR